MSLTKIIISFVFFVTHNGLNSSLFKGDRNFQMAFQRRNDKSALKIGAMDLQGDDFKQGGWHIVPYQGIFWSRNFYTESGGRKMS